MGWIITMETQPQINQQYAEKIIRESATALITSIEKVFMAHTEDIKKTIKEAAYDIYKTSCTINIEKIREIIYKETITPDSKVYAYCLKKISIIEDYMLVMVIATNDTDAAIKLKDTIKGKGFNPLDWNIKLCNNLNIGQPTDLRSIYGHPSPEYGSKPQIEKEPTKDVYITNLMYARDKLAKTPHQKGILTQIINNIKK